MTPRPGRTISLSDNPDPRPGRVIKAWLKKKGKTQKWLAGKVRCSEATVNAYLAGRRSLLPNLMITRQMCRVFRRNLSDLYTEAGWDAEQLATFEDMGPASYEIVKAVLKREGKNQKWLAEKVWCSTGTINAFLNGRRPLHLDWGPARKIRDILKLSLNDLYGGGESAGRSLDYYLKGERVLEPEKPKKTPVKKTQTAKRIGKNDTNNTKIDKEKLQNKRGT